MEENRWRNFDRMSDTASETYGQTQFPRRPMEFDEEETIAMRQNSMMNDSRPNTSPMQNAPKPNMSPMQSDPKPNLSPMQTEPKSNMSPIQSDPKPNLSPMQTMPKPNMSPMNMEDDNNGMALAMAYVPMQKWRKLYDPETGFERGTIFQELDKPWIGEAMK